MNLKLIANHIVLDYMILYKSFTQELFYLADNDITRLPEWHVIFPIFLDSDQLKFGSWKKAV